MEDIIERQRRKPMKQIVPHGVLVREDNPSPSEPLTQDEKDEKYL